MRVNTKQNLPAYEKARPPARTLDWTLAPARASRPEDENPLQCSLALPALEFTCWNGEVAQGAFVLDCHDREVIRWLATTAGISGEMIRDMLVRCVERRYPRAAPRVQWFPTTTGSLLPTRRSTSLWHLTWRRASRRRSPESNGTAEAVVKTFKPDYIRVSLIANAAALCLIDSWMEDSNTVHPNSQLG